MKIIISANTLLKNLTAMSGLVANANTMPILDNFLFDFDGNKLSITASDLETTMSVSLDITSQDKGCVAVPAKLLIEVLKTLPEQPLTFDFSENKTVEINSQSGKYELAYYPGEEFPKAVELENPSTTIISSKILASAISKTLFATGNNDLRPQLTGVYFNLSNSGTAFVATDSFKLVEYIRNDVQSSQEANFIMPKKPLAVLKNILGTTDTELTIEFNESNAKFILEKAVVSCRLIDSKYPNYKAVIPKDNPNIVTINRVQFLNSLKCVSIFSAKETHQIKLSAAANQLKISAEDASYSNKADETLTCNYQGAEMEIGFNSRFLIEILNNISSEDVLLEMSQSNKAGILKPTEGMAEGEELLMLLMPSMLK